MAFLPIPLEFSEPEGSDSAFGPDVQGGCLTPAECRALRAFFELLAEWDGKEAERT